VGKEGGKEKETDEDSACVMQKCPAVEGMSFQQLSRKGKQNPNLHHQLKYRGGAFTHKRKPSSPWGVVFESIRKGCAEGGALIRRPGEPRWGKRASPSLRKGRGQKGAPLSVGGPRLDRRTQVKTAAAKGQGVRDRRIFTSDRVDRVKRLPAAFWAGIVGEGR